MRFKATALAVILLLAAVGAAVSVTQAETTYLRGEEILISRSYNGDITFVGTPDATKCFNWATDFMFDGIITCDSSTGISKIAFPTDILITKLVMVTTDPWPATQGCALQLAHTGGTILLGPRLQYPSTDDSPVEGTVMVGVVGVILPAGKGLGLMIGAGETAARIDCTLGGGEASILVMGIRR